MIKQVKMMAMGRKDMKVMRKGFSQRFNEALSFAGLQNKSFAQLSPIFQTSRQTIHKWLHKDIYPSVLSAKLISEELDVSFEWLMLGEGLMGRGEKPTVSEMAILRIYRNLDSEGKKKHMKFALEQLMQHEIHPRTKVDNQKALKLVVKD